jgi:integrase
MGRDKQLEGVYAREASILVSFQWQGRRHRERISLNPTSANLRAAFRLRAEVISAISLGPDKFTIDDFARYFPDSPWLKKQPVPAGATFGEIADAWMMLAGQELAATTIKEYRNTLNKHFLPAFGQTQISAITYDELSTHMAAMAIKSPRTFNNVMIPARQVFAHAMKTKKLAEDVTRDINSRKSTKPAPDPLDTEEIGLVLAHLRAHCDEQWLNYFEFAFFSGIRPSEQIALKWGNVDFRREQVRIDAARVRAIDKGPKTHSIRDIDLQEQALAALMRQKKHTYLAGEHIFHNPYTGEPFPDTGSPVQIAWRPALKKLGIRDRDARQTRHTFATMCLHAGMNPAYVSAQMGHANPRMFFEVYSKWMNGAASDREKAKLSALFAQPKPPAKGSGIL